MTIVRHADAAAFLAASEEYRTSEPLLTNIIGSVATAVHRGRAYDSELWLTVHEEGGPVAGIAMRTGGRNLTVSPMPGWAAREVGRFVAAADPGLPGVNGPRDAVAAVIDGLDLPAHRGYRIAMTDVLYRLMELRAPADVPGSARRASIEDRDLLEEWHASFAADAGLRPADAADVARSRLSESALWLWEVDGRPVSMAGHAPVVDGPAGAVARVGPVFTPAAERGRGYAAACTAAVVRDLSPRCADVMLYADAANATSNRLYQRLGFARITEIVETELVPVAG